MIVANIEIDSNKKYTSNAGNFDGHADTAVCALGLLANLKETREVK
jgi:hypothetical protein